MKFKQKGSILDIFFISIVIFIFAIVVIVGHVVLTEFKAAVPETTAFNLTDGGNISTKGVLESGQGALLAADAVMPFIIVALVILAIIFAFLIPSHPIFAVITIFTLVIIIVIVPQISNMFNKIATSERIVASADQFTITVAVFNNLPLIITLIGAVLIIAMFVIARRPSISD